jgi:high-affinity K+ transport system ATPase subunit B
MIFSQHPTTSLNLNLLLFNPLALVFIPAVIKGKRNLWTKLLLVMLILYGLGGILQSYSEGMWIVALCLLIRCKK